MSIPKPGSSILVAPINTSSCVFDYNKLIFLSDLCLYTNTLTYNRRMLLIVCLELGVVSLTEVGVRYPLALIYCNL
jgi:hypothetical protein